MAETSPIPALLAFIVCDTVIHDAATQKRTLVGIFDRIASRKVPFPLNIGLYAKMVDGSGPYEIKLRMVNLTKDEALVMEIKTNLIWNNPDGPMEIGMNFAGIPIPEFGMYEFQLHANGIYVGRATLRAIELKLPPQGSAGGD